MYILNLQFTSPINKDNVNDIVEALLYAYPSLTWPGGEDIDRDNSKRKIIQIRTLVIQKNNGDNDYVLLKSSSHHPEGEFNLPAPTNGWNWVGEQLLKSRINYDETSGFFDSLNESASDDKDSEVFEFEWPIDDWDKMAVLLKSLYPGITWNSYADVDEYTPEDAVAALRIRKRPDGSYALLCSTENGWHAKNGYTNIKSGNDLIQRGLDQTSGFFDSLNESIVEDIPREFILCFEPVLTKDRWEEVSNALMKYNPSIMWANNEPLKAYDVFEEIEGYGEVVSSVVYSSWPSVNENLPVLTWTGSDENCAETQERLYSYHKGNGKKKLPIINGWQFVEEYTIDYDETSDLFDSLNESEGQYPRELNLCFNPPITKEEWDDVAQVLHTKNMSWGTRESVFDYNPFTDDYDGETLNGVGMVSYFKWPFENKAVLTWNSTCDSSEGGEVRKIPFFDGWKWFQENSINYDETSDFFNSLDESALIEESIDKTKVYLIKKDIKISWEETVKILKETFNHIRWAGSTIDELDSPSVGDRWQTLAVHYDNYRNLFVMNFGREMPERYLTLYPKHELINISELHTDFDQTSDFFNSLNESTGKKINNYKLGDKLYCKEDLFYKGTFKPEKFATQGRIYEIIRLEEDYDWYDYGYTGNRYVVQFDDDASEDEADHSISDRFIDNNFILIPKGTDNLDIDFDKIYESEGLEWAEDVVSNASDVVSYVDLYEGIKVLPGGPDWDWGSQGMGAKYGTLQYRGDQLYTQEGPLDDENGGYWADIEWFDKNGNFLDSNNYRVGPMFFDLRLYLGSDKLNEAMGDYKSKMYTQKFEPGDRVIMNGSVGGKTFSNELGTILKYKWTGGGTGHPHRVYLILFDTWNDKKNNFLMSPVQADQNRDFIDTRCREGSCWYSVSDNLEPAPDSSELFRDLD